MRICSKYITGRTMDGRPRSRSIALTTSCQAGGGTFALATATMEFSICTETTIMTAGHIALKKAAGPAGGSGHPPQVMPSRRRRISTARLSSGTRVRDMRMLCHDTGGPGRVGPVRATAMKTHSDEVTAPRLVMEVVLE